VAAAIAVFRLSGPQAGQALQHLTAGDLPEPRRAVLRDLKIPQSDELIDRALLLWFPEPHSFTGEDMAELHIHGGRAGIALLSDILSRLPGLRLAEPGEFSRRAFEAGKLDLTAIEGIADLIAAETEAQHRQAARQMAGEIGAQYEAWRAELVVLLAEVEAAIDFPDEDLPGDLHPRVARRAGQLLASLRQGLDDGRRGERLRDGLSVAVIGSPNAGKSSLINILARREAAIVTAVPGTTRDVIEVHLDLEGYPLILADTAGLRATEDVVESEGVRRARARAEEADLRLMMIEAQAAPRLPEDLVGLQKAGDFLLLNKIDLLSPGHGRILDGEIDAGKVQGAVEGLKVFAVSLNDRRGIELVLAALAEEARLRLQGAELSVVTRARHRRALEECVEALARFAEVPLHRTPELVAEDVRMAARALGRVTGHVDVEEVLGALFAEFCIGK
jgi:tRNA modification GTPase